MIQKILFPVDFSPSCVGMAVYVKRAAAIFGAEVTLVHVCDLSSHNGFELFARTPDAIAEEHWNLARSKLELFLNSEFPSTKSPRVLLAGDPAALIMVEAKKRRFDLIMMPTHAGQFRQMLLGSTTAKVLSDADCPVLTMQHAATIAPRSLEHRTWICAVELSSDPERLLLYAREAASAAGAKLSVVHAIQTGEAGSKVEKPSEEKVRALQQSIVDRLRTVGSDASVSIAFGPVKQVLLDAVRKSSADVLVLGRSTHSGALGRMRDLTYSLIRDSPCPVVSV
jgi:nucleotide-binding universal stress UspA family protein